MIFPTDKLPKELRDAVEGMKQIHNTPDAVSGSVLMSYICFAAEPLVNVDSIEFGARPVSDFFMLLLPSGAGKSTLFDEAKTGVMKWIERVHPRFLTERDAYDIDFAIWSDQFKAASALKDKRARREECLALKAAKPIPPLDPTQRMFKSSTPVGIFNRAKDAHPALGIFTAEGGEFFGGHAFQKDSGQATQLVSMLTALWDGDAIEHNNSTRNERVSGARMSMCVMAQGVVSEEFLASRLFAEQGIHARMLLCQADHWEMPKMSDDPAVARRKASVREDMLNPFHRRIERMCGQSITFHPNDPRRIDPPVITWTVAARQHRTEWFNTVVHPQNDDGPFFRRMYEHAIRLAGALACFEGTDEIELHQIEAATALVDFYAWEWRRVDTGVVSERHGDERPIADRLVEWLAKKPDRSMTRREITRSSPRLFRGLNQAKQDSILKSMIAWEMIEHGEAVGGDGKTRDIWKLT